MGCCISFNKKFPHQPKHPVMLEPDINNRANRAPPSLPCLEEETVKEVVLSETPLPKPHQNSKDNTTQIAIIQECEEEISKVSEIYSISESFSTTTSTTTTTTTVALTEIKDDEAISKETSRELNYRSPAKVPREIPRGAKSPAKRAGSSSRVVSRRLPGRTVSRNLGPTRVMRRESVSGFSRGSPATGRRSPGKVTTGRTDGKFRVENEGKKEVNDGVLVVKTEINEPRISLECFIFL